MAATCVPARQVGGDLFNAMVLPDGRLSFTVADVCDKCVGAALYMALIRSLLRISLQQGAPGQPAGLLQARAVAFTSDCIANEHARDNMFATVLTAILCPRTGQLDYINAGHDAPLLWRQGASQPESLPPQGLAVGMMAGQVHQPRSTHLRPGESLLAFTDGLPEALSPEDEPFGEQRVMAALAGARGDPQALLARFSDELAVHQGPRPPHDDVTLLCSAADPCPRARSASRAAEFLRCYAQGSDLLPDLIAGRPRESIAVGSSQRLSAVVLGPAACGGRVVRSRGARFGVMSGHDRKTLTLSALLTRLQQRQRQPRHATRHRCPLHRSQRLAVHNGA